MKCLIFFLLFCLPTLLFSQSKLEILVSPDLSYRVAKLEGIFKGSNVKESESPKFNFHFQANYFQQLKPKFWLKIGVGFASLGYKTEKITLISSSGITGTGIIDPLLQGIDNPTSQFIYDYQFLEIPFLLHLDFSKKKLKSFVELGIAPMYYLRSTTKHKLGGETRFKRNEQESIINDIQFSTKIAFGLSYSFNEKWEMVAQPNFSYHLNKITNTPISEKLWSTGIALGMRMAMK